MNFGVGSPLLTHSLIISLIPLPQLSKYFLIYSTFAIRGLDGQEAYSEFKLSMSISEGAGIFNFYSIVKNSDAHRPSGRGVLSMAESVDAAFP